MVATNAAFARLYDLLTSMPGVGAVLACTLIALLPELGRISRRQIAALVGLAPFDFDSGKLAGPVASRRSSRVRHVLYMAALALVVGILGSPPSTITSTQPEKSPKVVIVALMRKMIATLNAMLRDSTTWVDRYSGRRSASTAR